MIKAFISHSSKQKDFALELVNRLGRDYCKIDCYNFESAYKSINEIYRAIEESTIFVLLISRDSLGSTWVEEEIRFAKEKLSKTEYERFWPFIIDDSMAIDDCPEWMKKDECFNLRRFKSPYVLARDIEQKFRKIIWSANPKIRLLDTTMVGRNEDIAKFEDKFQSGRGMKLRALIISGRDGVGKETFAKQCMYKVGYPLEQVPYRISMDVKENIENFIVDLNMITRTYAEKDLLRVLSASPKEKSKTAVKLLNELYETRSVVFVEDNMSCVLPNRTIPEWLADITNDKELNPQLGLYIQSRIIPNVYLEAEYPEIAHIPLLPLSKKDRHKLFYSYIRTYEVSNITEEDACFFVDRLLQSPMQIQQAVEAIKTKSVEFAKKDIEALITMGDKKIHPLLERYKEEEQRELLVIMSRFDFISYDILEDIFEERIKEVLNTLLDMMIYGIVSTFGPSNRFFRLDHYLSDYIKRNHFSLPKDLELHIDDVLEKRIGECNDITKDTSLYLYEVKKQIMSGYGNAKSYLIPSIVIRSVMDIYNKRDYELVIDICDKVLKDSHNYYSDITRELTYWLCLALCRTQKEERFYEEVKALDGADYWFLKGFFQRIATKYNSAENFLKKALEISPSMQRAKRELVTALLAQHRYPEALSLAKENYERDSDNTYHMHAYFRCLVKKVNINREDIATLKELLDKMENSYSDKKEELHMAMNIEFQANIKRKSPDEMLDLIRNAEKNFPSSVNIQRAAHEYKLKQAIVSKEVVFPED